MKRVLLVAAAIIAAACGSKSTAPSTVDNSLSAPSSFTVTLQQVFMTSNTIAFSWSSTGATTYKLSIGTTSGGTDMLTVDVTGTSYTWTAPRDAKIYYARVAPISGGQVGTASTEIPLFTLDLRFVIDALFFAAGPMSQNAGFQPPVGLQVMMWPDGITLNVLVTNESGALSLDAARVFIADYLAMTSNHISITLNTTSLDYKGVLRSQIPQNTVIVRVDDTICPAPGVIACAYFGPLPYGNGNSFVNLNGAPTANTPGGSVAISHEIGHAFGYSHLVIGSSGRPEFRFLMNPILAVSVFSDVEKTAVAAARAGGLRANWTREQAVAAGLVFATANPVGGPAPGPLTILRDLLEPPFIR